MPITAKQREFRRSHIGSSDIAAILGKDPYKTAYDVWLDKTGQLPPQEENESMFAGTMFESGVLGFAERELGKLKRNQYRSVKSVPIGSNIDAIVCETGNPVEAKTAGLFGPVTENWGAAETDEVPDRVILQAHSHMLVTGTKLCHVAAFIGGRGFVMYHVPADMELMVIISQRAEDFWFNHVVPKIAPDDSLPSLPAVKRVSRIPNTTVSVADDIVNRWLDAKASLQMAGEEKEAAEAALLAALGNAEAGSCSFGKLTYFQSESNRIDSTRFKAELPELAAQYMKTSQSRTLRYKADKKS
jgi:putative phage-type endonuclease